MQHGRPFAASLALAACSGLACAAEEPIDTAREFYGWVLSHPSHGLPSPKDRAELARFVAPDLLHLLKSAAETEARCVKAAPKGEKPLVVEGDVFVGNYEGASEVAYGPIEREGDAVSMEANLVYIDTRFAKSHPHRVVAWQDRLEMRLMGGRWMVQDAHFLPDRTLTEELEGYLDEGRRACGKP